VPCGPINTIDGGFAMAERFGLEPVVEVGEGERAVPTTRHPIRFSETPASYRLPPPEPDEHGAEIRAWLNTPPPAGTSSAPHVSRAPREDRDD
jgi:crotonobetainyl-CoA:carnitine CoA-transferase CaiB-like acyl-CoA transferase